MSRPPDGGFHRTSFALFLHETHPIVLCLCLNPALQVASQQMTGFNAQQYAKFLSGLAALNLAPPADIQEVLCDVQTATRIVGSAMRVRHSTFF